MSGFYVDAQTLRDLEVMVAGTPNGRSMLGLLAEAIATRGGRLRLKEMLETPMSDRKQIAERSEAVRFFQENGFKLKLSAEELDFIEHYLNMGARLRPSWSKALVQKIKNDLRPNNDYYVIRKGVAIVVDCLRLCHHFAEKLAKHQPPALIQSYCTQILGLFSPDEYQMLLSAADKKVLTAIEVDKLDYLFRQAAHGKIRFIVWLLYEFEVFQSVAAASVAHNFTYPVVIESPEPQLKLDGLFHPFISKPIANDMELSSESNLCFVTGGNMAGKSTFLKSLAIATYLAHVGFPVPAGHMAFTTLNGLMTTINLSDNVSVGYSHFYSEVMRVKDVAKAISTHGRMLIIFDELFRGTNVKDAFEGSLAVISAFSAVRSCFFAVSTHITEVAAELKAEQSIQFRFFETIPVDGIPTYTYQLKNGISEDRLGMYIIHKEGVVAAIESLSS